MDEHFPVKTAVPALLDALGNGGCAVLQAPTGSGKTTRLPLALLDWGGIDGRIVMLEPRRVAARAAAERMAASLGEAVGGRVGYRMRGEAKLSRDTRIEVLTEGILTRMLQHDPELAGVGCVIFDEFHERSLNADLGLALCMEMRAALRPDLKLLVMSATLDAGPVAALLDAPLITAEGRSFEVEVHHKPAMPMRGRPPRLEAVVAAALREVLAETSGGVLVFLPGEGEIRRVMALMAGLPDGVEMLPLYGALPFAQQRRALAPVAGRKLVLASAIAETSVTIPDISVVVDAGLARRSRYDAASGMARLVTERVSRAEATQRQGRAGRVGPGQCFRLWSKGEEGALAAFAPPEIAAADLAPLVLELAIWGARSPDDVRFLTPPPAPAWAAAVELMQHLGALDAAGGITAHGRALAQVPAHPRLAHMLVAGGGALAAELAALLSLRVPMRAAGVDIAPRLHAMRSGAAPEAKLEARRLAKFAGAENGLGAGALLALAYPDRIAMARPGGDGRYLMAGGKEAALPQGDGLAGQGFLVAADLDGDMRSAKIRLAAALSLGEIEALHGNRIAEVDVCTWSRRDRAVLARRQRQLDALVLSDAHWPDARPEAVAAALCEGVAQLGLASLPWSKSCRYFVARVQWARRQGAELPDFSDAALLAALDDWLAPFLGGLRRAEDLARVALMDALQARLGWAGKAALDDLAPAAIVAPTGTRLAIDYGGAQPSVSVRLQEMFGQTRHPCIGPKHQPLLVELLSPAQRPVQITADLPGFWANSYSDVRKDLRGRYPRHHWPEDPAAAEATRRAKPRSG
ncbi:MAG: ATP-dependent helicase HrpB [Paracoccaceae bacterium]